MNRRNSHSPGWKTRVVPGMAAVLFCLLLTTAEVLKPLSEMGMDLLFRLRGERHPPQEVVVVGIDEKSLLRLGQWPFPRHLHTRLLQELGMARAIGFDILFQGKTVDDMALAERGRAGPPLILASANSYENHPLELAPELLSVGRMGYIETLADTDGTVRRVELCRDGATSFAAAVVDLDCSRPSLSEPRWINFYGPAFSFLSLSYSDVLNGEYSREFFTDRIVLIGARALALGDVHRTPMTERYPLPGVEVQATIVSNLLDASFLVQPRAGLVLSMFPVLLLAVLLWPAGREGRNLIGLAGCLLLLWLIAWFLFSKGYYLDPLPASLAMFLAYLLHLLSQWLGTTLGLVREIRRVQDALTDTMDRAFVNLPVPLQAVDSWDVSGRLEGGLRRHLQVLHQGIELFSVQSRLINKLLARETPPLALWDRETRSPLLFNRKFGELWQKLTGDAVQIPQIDQFLQKLSELQVTDAERYDLDLHSMDRDSMVDIEVVFGGRKHYFRVLLHPVSDFSLGSPGIMASVTDVTNIRELERMRAEVVNIVSHELKLPLTTMLGYAEMLADSTTGEKRGWAENIQAQVLRLSSMIEGFLSITRIESGRFKLNAYPFDPLSTIQDCVSGVMQAGRKKGVEVRCHLPVKATPILGDESLIVQVVLNVLDNAIKFSPPETVVEVSLVEREHEQLVRVADQGPGVPEAERALVFEKFVRASRAEGSSKGFGLGLSFVREVVEAHGGRVEMAESASGGCLVELRLPKARV